jgi:hypothetical protein
MNTLRGETTVNIGEETYGVLMGLNAWRQYCEAEGIDLGEFQERLGTQPLSVVPRIVHYGIKTYNLRNDIDTEAPSSEKIAAFVLEDDGQIMRLMEAINNANVLGEDQAAEEK